MKLNHWIYKSHLEKDEEIFVVIHRHWLILKTKIWKASMFGILPPVILFYFFPKFWPVFAIWFSVGIFFYFVKSMEWYYDCLLVTNLGVIDIERRGVFDNSSKRIEYESIDGVSYVVKGFLPTLLNYGDIIVDKMGSDIQINLEDAANPRRVEKIIMKHQEECMEKKSYTDHEALKGLLADMISTHVKKHGYKTTRKD